jgi:hypothetical protein
MYENRIMKTIEIVLKGGRSMRENDKRGESKILCKNMSL